MKKKILIMLPVLLFVVLGMAEMAKAQPDTLWTRKSSRISGAIFTLDGSKVLVGDKYGSMLLTADSGMTVWSNDTLEAYPDYLVMPDSTTIITRWALHIVVFRNVTTGALIKYYDSIITKDYKDILPFRDVVIENMCLSDDGNYLFVMMKHDTNDYKGTHFWKYRLYKVDTRYDSVVSKRDIEESWFMHKLPGQNYLVADCCGGISFISTDSLAQVKNYKFQKQYPWETIYCLDVSHSGNYVAIGTHANRILIWNTQQDSLYRTIICDSDSTGIAGNITFSTRDSIIVFDAGPIGNYRIKSWNINNNQLINEFPNLNYYYQNDAPNIALKVSPDGSKVLAAGSFGLYVFSSGLSPIAHKQDDNPQAIISINPNPSEHKINIEFEMINPAATKIMLYDEKGNYVKEIANRDFDSGTNRIEFDSKGLANGVYFIKFTNNQINKTEKIIIVR